MQPTPPKFEVSPSLPQDWAERKVVVQYGERDAFESVAVVPKGMFYGPAPDGPGGDDALATPSEWMLYVYDLDRKADRAMRMCKVRNWKAVKGAFKPR